MKPSAGLAPKFSGEIVVNGKDLSQMNLYTLQCFLRVDLPSLWLLTVEQMVKLVIHMFIFFKMSIVLKSVPLCPIFLGHAGIPFIPRSAYKAQEFCFQLGHG